MNMIKPFLLIFFSMLYSISAWGQGGSPNIPYCQHTETENFIEVTKECEMEIVATGGDYALEPNVEVSITAYSNLTPGITTEGVRCANCLYVLESTATVHRSQSYTWKAYLNENLIASGSGLTATFTPTEEGTVKITYEGSCNDCDVTASNTIYFCEQKFLFSTDAFSVNEGGSASFGVKLNKKPDEDVTIKIDDGDSFTITSGETLTFTAENWDTYQYATVYLHQDAGSECENLSVSLHTENYSLSGILALYAKDNDFWVYHDYQNPESYTITPDDGSSFSFVTDYYDPENPDNIICCTNTNPNLTFGFYGESPNSKGYTGRFRSFFRFHMDYVGRNVECMTFGASVAVDYKDTSNNVYTKAFYIYWTTLVTQETIQRDTSKYSVYIPISLFEVEEWHTFDVDIVPIIKSALEADGYEFICGYTYSEPPVFTSGLHYNDNIMTYSDMYTDDDALSDDVEEMFGLDPCDSSDGNTDLDGDGIGTADEYLIYKTDPLEADTDGDGVNDGAEINTYATDPLKKDTDGDGFLDGWEIQYGFDPKDKEDPADDDLETDADGDGLTLKQEAQYNTNPNSSDTDGDGLADYSEAITYKTDPLKQDTDDDGLSDKLEVIDYGSNPLLADTDGDSLSDGAEVNTHGTNPLLADTDGDGLSDYLEISVYSTSPTSADTDGDGLPDEYELRSNVSSNPLQADSDGDGILDGDEDNDGDGLSNLIEYQHGMDPSTAAFDEVAYKYEYTILVDAEDSTLNGWTVTSLDSPSIINTVDPDNAENRVIQFAGNGTSSEYTFIPLEEIPSGQQKIEWRMKFTGAYDIYVKCLTSSGEVQIHYTSSFSDTLTGENIEYGLGLAGGLWKTVRRDLLSDLQKAQPSNAILSIESISIKGDGLIDDVRTMVYVDTDRDVIPDAVEEIAGMDINDASDAHGDIDNDGADNLQEFIAGTLVFIDSDSDGLSDVWEVKYFNSLDEDANSDTDNDGMNNIAEFNAYSNPTKSDTDNDGLSDGDEISTYNTSPVLSDTDGDGLSDYDEVNQHNTDPTKYDMDNDGLSDYDEIFVCLTAPNDSDSDDDGLSDGDEVNLYATNPLLADTDGDGLSDGDEVNLHATNPLLADTDSDGLSDGDEINIYSSNPENSDTDYDGLSDADEVNVYGTNPSSKDTDNDGISDIDEINKYFTSPSNADSDSDGLNDSEEMTLYGTNPLDDDTDGDALPDGYEINKLGTNPKLMDSDENGVNDDQEDPDSDGITNIQEYQNRMNPVSPAISGWGYAYEETILENAEDQTILGWNITSSDSPSITNVVDPLDTNNRAIQFAGNGLSSEYTFAPDIEIPSGQLKIEWKMNYSEDYDICVKSTTDLGVRYIHYTSDTSNTLGTGENIIYGLGSGSGAWKTIRRDLQKDLWNAQSGNNITSIDSIIVKGSGYIDAIRTMVYIDTDKDVIPDTVENLAGMDPTDASDASGDLDSDMINNLDEFLAHTLVNDIDSDGLDDVWEMLYFGNLNCSPGDDPDGDGLTNLQEYNANTNPTKEDSDGDGISDSEELANGTDPTNGTSGDGDNLPDDWENKYFGSLTYGDNDDPDGDGMSNLLEFKYKRNPNAPAVDDSSDSIEMQLFIP